MCMAAVRSRNFGVPWNGRTLKLLAPVIDMINHQQHAKSAMYLEPPPPSSFSAATSSSEAAMPSTLAGSRYVFLLVAGRNFSKGEQVHISYAKSCNDRLMLVYGFQLGMQNGKTDCNLVLQGLIDQFDEEE